MNTLIFVLAISLVVIGVAELVDCDEADDDTATDTDAEGCDGSTGALSSESAAEATIVKWWDFMSEPKPVKCRDRVWASSTPEPSELNTGARELVFKACPEEAGTRDGQGKQKLEMKNVGKDDQN